MVSRELFRVIDTFELEEELRLHPAHCLVLPGFPLREQGVDLVDEDYCRLDRTRNTEIDR
jgi:hypothetical protein